MRVLRSVLMLLLALALGFGSAPSAVAADSPTITTTLSGQVIGYAGVSNIDLYHWDGTSFVAVPGRDDQTAADGTFSIIADLITGDVYTLRASAVGKGSRYYGGSTTKPTTADAGFTAGASTIDLGTFSLGATYALNGVVLDETGVGLVDATVKVFASSANQSTDAPLAVGHSGDDGGYGFNQLPAGSYRVVADAAGYQPATSETVSITLAAVTVPELALQLGQSSITGTVRLPTGAAASGATVQAYRWANDDWTPDGTATAAADGGYRLTVPTKSKLVLFAKMTGYIGVWSGGLSSQPLDSAAAGVLTAADGLVVDSLELGTSFGAVAGQALDYCTTHTLASGDSYNEAKASLGFTANLYGAPRQSAFVTDRGFIYLADSSHRAAFAASDPSALDSWAGVPLIAPLWFDGDTTGTTPGSVTYGSSGDGKAFCVRWNNLGHYSGIEDNPNTFQLILQSKAGVAGRAAGDFDITFNYDQVLWDGSSSRAVGYTAGDAVAGHYWLYDGSTNPGVVTDSGSSALITHSVGSTTAGRYVFAIRNPLLNITPPKITGTPTSGSTLSVDPGNWSPNATYTYQWSLGGAPGPTSSTYQVPAKSQGKVVTVTVTATATGLSDVSVAAAPVTILATFSKHPTPKISGKAKVGSTLKVSTGTWSPKPTLSRQWYRSGVAIPGATGSKYKVKLADVGAKLTVRVVAAKSGYLGVTKTSKATKTVPKVPLKTSTPKIGGTAKVGRTLTLSPGRWTSGAGLTWRWYRSGKLIPEATDKSSYLLQLADKGKKITVKVTGSKVGYTTVTRTSAATRKVS